MESLKTIAAAVMGRLFADELRAWLPWLAQWLLRVAVRTIPIDERERCHEEWSADVESWPGDIARIFRALGIAIAGARMYFAMCKGDLGLKMLRIALNLIEAFVRFTGAGQKQSLLVSLRFKLATFAVYAIGANVLFGSVEFLNGKHQTATSSPALFFGCFILSAFLWAAFWSSALALRDTYPPITPMAKEPNT